MSDDATTPSRAEKEFAGLISTLDEAQRAVDVAGVHIACTEIIAGTHDLFTPWVTLSCSGWSDNGSCGDGDGDGDDSVGHDGPCGTDVGGGSGTNW